MAKIEKEKFSVELLNGGRFLFEGQPTVTLHGALLCEKSYAEIIRIYAAGQWLSVTRVQS